MVDRGPERIAPLRARASCRLLVLLPTAGITCLAVLLGNTPVLALPSRADHARETIYDLGFGGQDVRRGLEAVSGIIDKDVRQGQFKGNHRNFGHWGFGGSIPFESNPALREYVAKNPAARHEIVGLWADCVRRIERHVSDSTGIPPGSQARGLATFIYDHHLLSDYADKVIEPLQPVSGIQRDMVKASREIFGSHSEFATQLEQRLASIPKDLPMSEQARLTLNELREAKLGRQLQKTFPKQFVEGKMQLIDEEVYSRNRHNAALLVEAPPPSILETSLKAGRNAALIAGAFSAAVNGRRLLKGEITNKDFLLNVSEDSTQAAIAGTVSTGILEKIGSHYVLTLPMKGALGAGIGVVIFDSTRNVWSLAKGDIDQDDFLARTAESMLKATASSTAVYVTILYGATPGGPVVMAVAIGSYVVADLAIRFCVRLRDSRYVSIEHMLGHLPLALLDRETIYDPKKALPLFDSLTAEGVFGTQPKRRTLLDGDFHDEKPNMFDP